MYLNKRFQIFDQDQDGFITLSEFKEVMVKLDPDITDEEVDEMMKSMDLDGDGKIDYEGI